MRARERCGALAVRSHPTEESRQKIVARVENLRSTVEYFTVDGMISAEMGFGGGVPSQGAIDGALRRCRLCMQRKGKWVRVDPDSGRLEFRRVRRQEINDYSTTHQSTREERNNSITNDPPTASTTDTPEDVTPEKVALGAQSIATTEPDKPMTEPHQPSREQPSRQTAPAASRQRPEGKAKAQGKARAKGKAKPKAKGKAKGAKAPDQKTVARTAESLSNTFEKVVSRGKRRISDIENNVDNWSWANTDRFKGKLERLVKKAEDSLDAFPELRELVKNGSELPEQVLDTVTESMKKVSEVQDTVDAVETQCKRLKTLHEQDQSNPSQE